MSNLKLESFLLALRLVESADDPSAIGDNGQALGAYQIHECYFEDSNIQGNYVDVVTDPDKDEQVVLNYFSRYGKGYNFYQLARLHNGGPNWANDPTTHNYALKVHKKYKEIRHGRNRIRVRDR